MFWVIISPFIMYFVLWHFSSIGSFIRLNNIKSYFRKNRYTWKFLKPRYTSAKKSVFMSNKQIGKYGIKILGLPIEADEIPMLFIGSRGCVVWLELTKKFSHTVVDSLNDKKYFNKYFNDGLPTKRLILEGDFPSFFKIYHEPGYERLTLQILTPDRMLFLVERLKEFNIEIQDNYIRLYAANAQNSSQDFNNFLDAIESLKDGFKVSRLNSIRN